MSETLHPEEVVTSILLIRHGHTAQTENGKLYSDPAAVLTEKGRLQAQNLASFLSGQAVQLLLSSPSQRVRSTAALIADGIGLETVIAEKLFEHQVGEWEGRSYLEIKKAEPDVYANWSKDPIRNAPPGGESIEQLFERSGMALDALVKAHAGMKIAIVTHAEIIRAILVRALGMPLDNYWRLSVPTGSISRVDLSEHFATLHYTALVPEQVRV